MDHNLLIQDILLLHTSLGDLKSRRKAIQKQIRSEQLDIGLKLHQLKLILDEKGTIEFNGQRYFIYSSTIQLKFFSFSNE